MLETFYNNFGFTGALLLSFSLFICFIFWMAGLAGISMKQESNKKKTIRLVIAVLLPIYPFFWMILDMITQKKDLGKV
jgi:hypothetical protein